MEVNNQHYTRKRFTRAHYKELIDENTEFYNFLERMENEQEFEL